MTRITPKFSLGFIDLKNIFNDIPTGYTPTNAPDESFRDFSKLENLDTPTPLENPDTETVFVYSVNNGAAESHGSMATDARQPLHYCKPEPCSEVGYTTAFGTTDGLLLTPQQQPIAFCYPDDYQNIEEKQCMMHHSRQIQITSSTQYSPSCPTYTTPPTQNDLRNDSNSACTLQSCASLPPAYASSPLSNNSAPALYTNTTELICNADPPSYLVQQPSCRESTPFGQLRVISSTPPSDRNPTEASTFAEKANASIHNCMLFDVCELSQLKKEDNAGTKSLKCTKILEKAFLCEFPNCVKRFARVDELKRHQRTHSDVKQFVCDICQKGFTRSDHLMTHRRTHTGERPYPCWYCDRRFARSDERNRHAKVHSREKTGRSRKPRGSKVKTVATGLIPSAEVPTVWLNNLSLMT
ncbi:hypothetical protein CSKR_103759 [Clonorchis sinensis]|uniref:Early growth response protein 1-B n=2 Tax=Clonorchis sinensis TaxID=79923 RepID=G7YLA8_CLOSI|nr:hypothetical protein CSKR_103759 [Clonorchis sinensis]GAA53739.1 early growth response protein 1-B [Clonorchis sinensis]